MSARIKGWIQESQEEKWNKYSTSKVNSICKCTWVRRNWVVVADEGGAEGTVGCKRHCTHTSFEFDWKVMSVIEKF